MKRSEMINILASIINTYSKALAINNVTAEKFADRILREVEKAGMIKCEKRVFGDGTVLYTPEGWDPEESNSGN